MSSQEKSSQENSSALSGNGGGRATVHAEDALKGVERARERARLQAGRAPAWYGPAVAVALVLPSAVQVWSRTRGGWATPLALLVSLLGLAAVFALVRAARRTAGVRVERSLPSRLTRSRTALPAVLAAGLAAGACCWAAGAGEGATRITAFAVWGLGVWGVCLVRNAAIDRALGQLA
ncbi:hypothetical protein EDD93_2772 [Streptomyces sp. 840.1]|uniref:hypothetical protein n=1 Tax=Streptomyces sp. 840.1 TaxID=2485152 RepID=UPI000FBEEDCB|nr:hypothetical protein [Streptomyces sp. 840.1]ROQ68315.1 hypothetical protein EDD93_2772 [Streptomyces sp. 840.1]